MAYCNDLLRGAACLLVGALSSGCLVLGSGSGSNDDDASMNDDGADDGDPSGGTPGSGGTQASTRDLDACRGDLDDDEVNDAVVITEEYGDSLHEMVACGQLSVALCGAVISGIFDAILAQSNDATPDGWEFVGEGVYRTSNSSTNMQSRFYLAEDFSFGKAGDPVRENLFLVDSYLVNAALSIDWSTGATEIVYDTPGPLVELLGMGANPPNPLPVDINDLASLQSKLEALEFEGDIMVMDQRDASTIAYDVHVPRMSAGAVFGLSAPLRYELVDVDGEREDLGQTIVTLDFDVAYASHGSLDGTVDFRVEGGPLDYLAHLAWDHEAFPTTSLSCP